MFEAHASSRFSAIFVNGSLLLRDWTLLPTSSYSKVSGVGRPHGIGFVAYLFFSTLESGFKKFRIRCRIRRIRVDESRIRKEKVADSKKSVSVWTGPLKLAIYKQTYKSMFKIPAIATVIYLPVQTTLQDR